MCLCCVALEIISDARISYSLRTHVEEILHFPICIVSSRLIDEWIPMNSSRLRTRQMVTPSAPPPIDLDDTPPKPASPKPAVAPDAASTAATAAQSSSTGGNSTAALPSAPLPLSGNLPVLKKAPYNYIVGEKCMAKWTDSRRWRATVQSVLELGMSQHHRKPPRPQSCAQFVIVLSPNRRLL